MVGVPQKDQAEDGAGVFLRLQAGIGAELIGGIPQALFERGGGGVFFGGSDPEHEMTIRGKTVLSDKIHPAIEELCELEYG